MSPVYLNPQQSSSIPFLEFKGDHQQHSLPLLGYVQHDRVNNPYFSRSGFENHHASSDFLAIDYSRIAQDKVVEKLILSQDKPSDRTQAIQSSTQLHHYAADGSGSSYVYPFDQGDHHKIEIIRTDQQPKKCKPTKLRIMQRTTSPKSSKITREHKVHHGLLARNNSNETNNNGLRMCTDCHTTTTPLWRSGPQGPKSLCNACGIRQRKARRAAMAAAAAAAEYAKDNGATTVTSSSSMSSTTTTVEAQKLEVEEMKPEMKFDRSHTLPLKKRSKTLNASWSFNNNNNSFASNNNNNDSHNGGDKLSLEDFGWNSSKNYIKGANSSQRVFPQDEEEGAILLMALSCGMACSS